MGVRGVEFCTKSRGTVTHPPALKQMLHLLLHDGQVVRHLAVAAGGNAVAVAASLPLLQRLDGLGVDETQEVVLIQGGSLHVLLAGVVRRTVQLDDVGQVAVAVVQVQLGVKSKIN